MPEYSWTCPICNRPVTITNQSINEGATKLRLDNKDGRRIAISKFTVCPNPECRKFTLELELWHATLSEFSNDLNKSKLLKKWTLIPESKSQAFPDYIPKAILDDYNEACLISELSPKASATLSRRCLQGMIRDFWGVKGKNLQVEIESIEGKVEPLTWQAIDAVRSVGNIGAHMEKDINLIIDVEPKEAELLMGLIEILLKDWYIARKQKELHLTSVSELAKDKETTKKGKSSS